MGKIFHWIVTGLLVAGLAVTGYVCHDNGLYENTYNNLTQQEQETETDAEVETDADTEENV